MKSFREWIEIHLGSTIETLFWELFDIDQEDFRKVVIRIEDLVERHRGTPMSSWFIWYRSKALFYLFLKSNESIVGLGEKIGWHFNDVAMLLREIFIEQDHKNESYYNEIFLVGNEVSVYLELSIEKILHDLSKSRSDYMRLNLDKEDNSLFEEQWEKNVFELAKIWKREEASKKGWNRKGLYQSVRHFLGDMLLLSGSAIFLIYVVFKGNQFYDQYLLKTIQSFAPDFLESSKSLALKSEVLRDIPTTESNIEEDFKGLADQMDLSGAEEEERFETETDVALSSLEEGAPRMEQLGIPKAVEEFRDQVSAQYKHYRVLLRSSRGNELTEEIDGLLKRYGATFVKKATGAKDVPGGSYYNVYVSQGKLKGFLQDIGGLDESQTVVGHVRHPAPPDQVRVFIWIKTI